MVPYVLVPRLLLPSSPKRVGEFDGNPTYTTIHETSLNELPQDPPPECNAEHYYKILLQDKNKNGEIVSVGYHYLVEADIGKVAKVYQFLPCNVYTHHCGNAEGNLLCR